METNPSLWAVVGFEPVGGSRRVRERARERATHGVAPPVKNYAEFAPLTLTLTYLNRLSLVFYENRLER